MYLIFEDIELLEGLIFKKGRSNVFEIYKLYFVFICYF